MILHPRLRYREARTFANEVRTLAEAARLERLPLTGIQAHQLRLLRWAVEYAHRKVPFYRDTFAEAEVRPDDIRSISDLERLPILTKKQILDNYPRRIVAEGYSPGNAFRCTSSGTSGVAATYLSDWATRDANFGLLYRARSLFGYRPKHVECIFSYLPTATRWYERLGFHRRIRVRLLQLPEKTMEQLLRIRPDVVYSLPSYLRMLCQEGSEELARLSILLVVSSGEILDPRTRKTLAEGFRAPVLDLYGAAEQPYISSECQLHCGQHLNMLNALIEVARDGERAAPGEIGDILVTTLTNRAMPLIRYRIGDAGRILAGECGCGRHGEILAGIEGRRDDFLKSSSGREIPPIVAQAAVLSTPGVKAFRVIQKSPATLVIQLVGQVEEEAKTTITGNLRQIMSDPDLEVTLEHVHAIEPDASGKRKVVICEA